MTWQTVVVLVAVIPWAILAGRWVWRRIDRHLAAQECPEACEVCGARLRRGWALHEEFSDTGEGDPLIRTAMSAFYCRQHRPAGAVRWPG